MLLYKPKKNQNAAKGERLLITVNVIGSAGPLRFVVFEEERVSKVIDIALKNYAREGRLPVLGSDLNDFLLYCPHAGQQPLNHWETIGSLGARNFMLCKKPKSEKVGEERARPADDVSRKGVIAKGFGGWKSCINKPLRLKITPH